MATQSPVGALLQTKLYIPPLRPEWVSRPRLAERLNAGIQRKLVLVSAPAGRKRTRYIVWSECPLSECGMGTSGETG